MSIFLTLVAGSTTESSSKSGSSGLITFIPIVLIGAAMYFLLIRPQKKRMREQQGLLKTIEEGDEIMTSGGIYGFVTAVDGDVLWVEIDHDKKVEIRIHRSAVSRKINPTVEPAGGAPAENAGDAGESGSAGDGKADE